MRKTVVAGLAAAGLLVAACGGGSGSSSGSSSGGSSKAGSSGRQLTAQTPTASGSLASINWNLPAGEPASLDPIYTWDTGSGNTVLANICESLMRQLPNGQLVPSLATSVSQPNTSTYVYTLRSGVTFSDGTPMTAADVAYSLNRNLSANPGSYWSVWYANVSSIAVTGASQVTVHLKHPDVLFGEMMALPAGAITEEAAVKAKGSAYGTARGGVVCTGPYQLANWSSGNSITLTRNPHYWDTTLTPKVTSVKFTFLTDDSAITNGLTSGAIDGEWNVPPSSVDELSEVSAGSLYFNRSTNYAALEMFNLKGGLKDVRIRQALRDAIDYAGISKTVTNDTSTPLAASATSSTWGYAQSTFSAAYDKLPAASEDLTAAKKLVQAAGPQSSPIVIAVNADNQTQSQVVASIQSTAKQAGLNVVIKSEPTATFNNLFVDPKARAGIDTGFVQSDTDIADPLELYIQSLPGSPYDFSGFNDPTATADMNNANLTSDPTQRAQLVTQAQAIFADQVGILLPVYAPDITLFLNKRVTGAAVSNIGSLYYPWLATLGAR